MTVVVIELTDIAFAVDSILAAIGLVGPPPADHPECTSSEVMGGRDGWAAGNRSDACRSSHVHSPA